MDQSNHNNDAVDAIFLTSELVGVKPYEPQMARAGTCTVDWVEVER